MLKIEDLVVAYGGIEALKGSASRLREGQIVTLVGGERGGKKHHFADGDRPGQAG